VIGKNNLVYYGDQIAKLLNEMLDEKKRPSMSEVVERLEVMQSEERES